MIRIRTGIVVLAAAALAALPGALSAQNAAAPPAAAPEGVPAEATQWLAEMQQLHLRLSQLQERALQDPELSARQDSLGMRIRLAMESIDPALPQQMGRIEEMEGQAAAAEARSDQAALQQLNAEAQQIQQQFLAAQQKALQQPELAAELTAFQTLLEQKILAVDPAAPQLLARFQELERKLTGLTQ
jgi:hypothetical protein